MRRSFTTWMEWCYRNVELPPCCIATEDGIKIQPQVLDYANKRSKKPKHIVKLVKAIYGAKNSSSAFYRTLVAAVTTSTKLKKFNFKVSDEDPCVFHSTTERGSILLAVQVDDIAALVCGRNKSKLEADGVMKSTLNWF